VPIIRLARKARPNERVMGTNAGAQDAAGSLQIPPPHTRHQQFRLAGRKRRWAFLDFLRGRDPLFCFSAFFFIFPAHVCGGKSGLAFTKCTAQAFFSFLVYLLFSF